MYVLHTHESLADQIKRLEESRTRHAAALGEIDQLLNRISQALKSTGIPDAPSTGTPWQSSVENRLRIFGENGRRKYRKMELTGDQAVIAFVRARGSATTSEINAQWRAEGRGGVANNAIVRLLKRAELVRETNHGSRGGRNHAPAEPQRQDPAVSSQRDTGATTPSSSLNLNSEPQYATAIHDRA